MRGHILVIDQGTTSTRAVVFDERAKAIASSQIEFRQIYPHPGWIEHDPEDIWRTTLSTAREALAQVGRTATVVALGIANQRETTLVWDRKSGVPIYNAIVWQDRRTADRCTRLSLDGHAAFVRERTGLVLDPYFSATKIAWILDNVPGARERAGRGELAFGTVDTFLLWRLTNGAVHATDATNAARTSLLDIRTGQWDDDLLGLFDVPRSGLPEVRDTAGFFGHTDAAHLGVSLSVQAMAGDQQSALIGQVCLTPGTAKATFGTGGFILLNAGASPIRARHGLLTTIAYQWDGKRTYALEGSIFAAGATVQWLRDGLGIIAHAAEAGVLAAASDPEQEVYLVPAFAGLGAPHWRADVRATVMGLTRGSTRKEIARAALESVGYQTDDLLAVMVEDLAADSGHGADPVIRVDGGMAGSNWAMQFLADIVEACVEPTDLQGDDVARRRASRRMARRLVLRSGGLHAVLGPRPALHLDDERGNSTQAPRRLAPRRRGHSASSRDGAVKVIFRCDPVLRDSLPRPSPALHSLPDWLRDMPQAAFSDLHEREVRTVKHCPPFVDAMRHGFVMRLPCDVTVKEGRFSWDWDLPPLAGVSQPRSPLSFHVPAQVAGTPMAASQRTLIKFNSFWTIELEAGYSLFATHPINRDDLPFRTLTGLVDSDRFNAVGILFPAAWTNPDFEGVLRAGTPVAQCFPVSREALSLSFEDFTPQQVDAYDEVADALHAMPGVYRKVYRDKRSSLDK